MHFVKRYIAPYPTASLFDNVVKIMYALAQARLTPEKVDSQRVAMTAHFQVRTLDFCFICQGDFHIEEHEYYSLQ